MWYVMQVVGGKEKRVLALLKRYFSSSLLQECFIPQYEIMRKYRGEWHRAVEILFPGYLVVLTNQPAQLASELRKVPLFTKLLGNNDVFIPLNDQEVSFFEVFTAPEQRVVTMSEGVIEGDRVVVLEGPLKGRAGMIAKIDRHKRLAYLNMDMMGRKKNDKTGARNC